MKRKVRDRLELDRLLRDQGLDGKLFRNDEAREKARWVLKQIRLGNDRKTIALER